jgi:hypothetical protein
MVRGSVVIIVVALIICITITALAPETGWWWQAIKVTVLLAGVFFAKLVRRAENNPYWRRWAPKMPPA